MFIDVIKTGENIKNLRLGKKMTRKEVADIVCVTPQAVYKWETGRCLPDIERLYSLSRYFNVCMDDIVVSGKRTA